jgi:hypothetical protein
MGIEWFYQVAGETRGPVSARELRALADAGTITPDTRVKRGSDRKWVSGRRVEGLFEPGSIKSAQVAPAPRKGPPLLPVPVCASTQPVADAVVDASKVRRLRRMRARHWMLIAGAVTLCLVFPTALIVGLKRMLETALPTALLVFALSLLGALWNVLGSLFSRLLDRYTRNER